jgi:undecaprenyl-diphosphatase
MMEKMELWKAVIQGIVEGLTEFLPVSSTGHLIISSHLLGIGATEKSKAFDVIIQSGAMFAVIWHYRQQLGRMTKEFMFRKDPGFQEGLAVLLAFLPSAVMGLLFRKQIKAYLFGITPVAFALVLGGILMLVIERRLKKRELDGPLNPQADQPENISRSPTLKEAFQIGCFQCLALWPGMSRSMTTILGARIVGLNRLDAASFSFLLAIPTLIGASLLDLYQSRNILMSGDLDFALSLFIGTVVSFLVALLVIRGFLTFVKNRGFEVFAYYRIAIGLLLWAML